MTNFNIQDRGRYFQDHARDVHLKQHINTREVIPPMMFIYTLCL